MRLASAFALLGLTALGAGVSGCYSKATAYGGKFTFAYPSMVEHDNFVKPIAPGAKLEVHAFANGTQEQLPILSATSSRPDVVDIGVVKQKSVVLVGKTPGVAEIEVRAKTPNGTELVDKMFFHVEKPAKHELGHACTDEPEAAYVVGDEVFIDHAMKTTDGRSVVGGDYAPLAIEPRGALELKEQPQAGGFYLFQAKSAKTVTLKSKIDDAALTLRIVERKDLSDARLLFSERMLVGRGSYIVASVSAGETTLCSQNALTKARSLTPDICKVTAKLDDDPDAGDSNREQLAHQWHRVRHLQVRGHAARAREGQRRGAEGRGEGRARGVSWRRAHRRARPLLSRRLGASARSARLGQGGTGASRPRAPRDEAKAHSPVSSSHLP